MANDAIRRALADVLAAMGAEDAEIQLERPRDPTHGDMASNVALTLARTLRRSPREIAEEIAERLDRGAAGVEKVEVAGPGFLNFTLGSAAVGSTVDAVIEADAAWGRSDEGGGRRVMVEFVSANPTGPLHLGHGRQAALGDAVASLFEWTGWDAHREFYYNDSGRQMELLALSVRARYRQSLGRDEPVGHPDVDRINVMGGSIGLGHPFGATGGRVTMTLVNEMARRDVEFGLVTVCAAGGMGFAMVVERA